MGTAGRVKSNILDAVQRDLAEQPAFNSWLLFCRRDVRSIAPSNTTKRDKDLRGQYQYRIIQLVVDNLDGIEAKREAE